jgi:hypothetical protein
VWSLAVVVFVFLDLASLGAYLDSGETDPTANFQHPQAFAFLRNDAEPFRIETPEDSWFQWQPNLGLIARLDDAAGIYNPLLLQRYDRYWKVAIGRDNALYDLLNTKYLVAKKDEKVAVKFAPVFDGDAQLKVWLNAKALPRAFMVYRSQVVADGDAAFTAITQSAFDPAQSIVLEGGEALNGSAPSVPTVGFAGRSTNSVELDVTTAADGYLFLGDTYYPGWKANVDGQVAPVERADYLFRAVKLTAGSHHVRFWFDPLSWKIGVALTSLGLMGIVVGWLMVRPR